MTKRRSYAVLYMDDEPACAALVARKLRSVGYEVDWVADGVEGLSRLASGSYDIVAVDHRMPRKDGLEVVRTLKAAGHRAPIVMITGTGCEAVAVEALKLGVNDYVMKDAEGEYINLLPSVLDQVVKEAALIEEKEAALGALRSSEERYRALVDQSPDGIMVCRGSTLAFANVAAARLLGSATTEVLIGKRLADVWPGAASVEKLAENANRSTEATDTPTELIEDELIRLDGKTIDVELAIVPLRDTMLSVQLIVRDITRRKRAEEALRKAHDELERRVNTRTKELQDLNRKLQEKVLELEMFHDVTVGREHKMMSLEKDIQRLTNELAAVRREPAT